MAYRECIMLPDVHVIKYIKMNKITLCQNGMDTFIIMSLRLAMIFFNVVTVVHNIALSLLCPD